MSGTAFSQAGESTVSMSVDFADYNGDGLMDFFKSDDTYCSLYENMGNGDFQRQVICSRHSHGQPHNLSDGRLHLLITTMMAT